MKIRKRFSAGFTLVEIMIVVAIIGLLAAVAIPNMVRARQSAQTNTCIRNLKTLDNAKQQWALEWGKTGDDVPPANEVQPYVGRGSDGNLANVHCPLVLPAGPMAGYDMNSVSNPPACKQNDPVVHPATL